MKCAFFLSLIHPHPICSGWSGCLLALFSMASRKQSSLPVGTRWTREGYGKLFFEFFSHGNFLKRVFSSIFMISFWFSSVIENVCRLSRDYGLFTPAHPPLPFCRSSSLSDKIPPILSINSFPIFEFSLKRT